MTPRAEHGPRIVGGRVTFEADGPASVTLRRLEEQLALRLRPTRVVDGTDWYTARVLGLRLDLAVDERPGGHRFMLSYGSDEPYHDTDADVVDVDFHFRRIVEAADCVVVT